MKSVNRRSHDIFSLAGWLFADMLLVLTLIFIVVEPPWVGPPPPPVICGVQQSAQVVYVHVSDPGGLIGGSSRAAQDFERALRATLGPTHDREAGLVEVFGGSPSVGYGVSLSRAAITTMRHMPNYVFTSKTAYFRSLWNGTISSNTVEVDVFYLILATSCKS